MHEGAYAINFGHIASTQLIWFCLPPLHIARTISCLPLNSIVFRFQLYYLVITQNSEIKWMQRLENTFILRQHFFSSFNSAKAWFFFQCPTQVQNTRRWKRSTGGGALLSNLVSYRNKEGYSAQLRKKWRSVKQPKFVSKPASACVLGLEEGFVIWSTRQSEVGKVRGVQNPPFSGGGGRNCLWWSQWVNPTGVNLPSLYAVLFTVSHISGAKTARGSWFSTVGGYLFLAPQMGGGGKPAPGSCWLVEKKMVIVEW